MTPSVFKCIAPSFTALFPIPSVYTPICEKLFTLIVPELRRLAVFVYIPTAPVLSAVKSIIPVFVPMLAKVPFRRSPTPSFPIFKVPEDRIFIFSAYIAVPFSKFEAFISILTFLLSFPVPL